ncbi:MAG: TetR/AcrR family transcriptional regulator [Oscillospiraceae bacterium]
MAAPLYGNIREKILNASAELLFEKAFSDISLSDIAKKSCISKGTLYYYYNSKDDILFDVANIYLDKLAQSLIEWTENREKDTSLPRLLNYTLERGIFDESGALRLYLIGAAVSGHEAVRKKLTEKYEYFKTTLSQKLKERGIGEDSEYTAWLILIVLDGILVQTQLKNPDFDAREIIKRTVRLLSKP